MRVETVVMWVGGQDRIPERFRGEGPFEVTAVDLEELSREFDVAIMHHRHPQPTRKQLRAGAPAVPDTLFLALDEPGKRFCQR